MKTCIFFGHRNITANIHSGLKNAIINLIKNNEVNCFYVGNSGAFDLVVYKTLKEIANEYEINYYVVLAYLPNRKNDDIDFDNEYYDHTILPENIETVPKRFAIDFRNRWIIKKADYVITYINHTIGSGAAKYREIAKKQGKTIIDIGNASF